MPPPQTTPPVVQKQTAAQKAVEKAKLDLEKQQQQQQQGADGAAVDPAPGVTPKKKISPAQERAANNMAKLKARREKAQAQQDKLAEKRRG